ncbi:MAG TPA: phosphatase PAP2 family protein [Acidimicrobiales bacterium]|nr:phosphatase PAP2 family protein [Acidimicrobiales bacterium]
MTGRLSSARRSVGHFDLAVDRAFDHLRGNRAADRLFYAASELGDFGLVWVLLGTAKGLRKGGDLEGALKLAAAMGVESVLVNGIIKSFFRRTRPPWEVERPLRVRRPLTSSFPSGHATAGFSAAMVLSEDDELAPLYFALAAVVATSRIYVKIHHASDVAGGVALGLLLGVLARRLTPAPRSD